MNALWSRFGNRRSLWIVVAVLAAAGVFAGMVIRQIRMPIVLRGAIVRASNDVTQQSPITGVEVTAADDLARAGSTSDFSGYFALRLQPWVTKRSTITLHFRDPDYQPLDVTAVAGDKLFVVRLKSVKPALEPGDDDDHPEVTIGNVVIRYSIQTTSSTNIGSAVKIFQVTNVGNVPCNHAHVCSPDGKWKAATGEATLDAGTGNEFRDARLSCIAGPCPFTKVDSDNLSSGMRTISVAIRDWSDSTTFVLQAEVFRVEVDELVRQYYPTIIGRTVNFSLPAGASGLTVEAEMNGTNIEFALGPQAVLSWADCDVSQGRDHVSAYRCELKPWCRFRQ
jgi:hypothetical protein